ncbi:hypothetical protein DFA_05850 [Cavenderia fasciculata]|uniref:Uncharacterized protein n=1 Tax=Cavenderia fasciculata TaxID=261658 RepID=F4PN26_CACFS|nr:uncharacterized protein DFA_05850 [Cavenderia fasciculata]EGG23716.1 hypothetical protein DFA_05850 [Cavenderia fasciculata]|eukprot:XP_004361567.1 hypothetical protein DFA_05850 [Cavenderia fasciculata]
MKELLVLDPPSGEHITNIPSIEQSTRLCAYYNNDYSNSRGEKDDLIWFVLISDEDNDNEVTMADLLTMISNCFMTVLGTKITEYKENYGKRRSLSHSATKEMHSKMKTISSTVMALFGECQHIIFQSYDILSHPFHKYLPKKVYTDLYEKETDDIVSLMFTSGDRVYPSGTTYPSSSSSSLSSSLIDEIYPNHEKIAINLNFIKQSLTELLEEHDFQSTESHILIYKDHKLLFYHSNKQEPPYLGNFDFLQLSIYCYIQLRPRENIGFSKEEYELEMEKKSFNYPFDTRSQYMINRKSCAFDTIYFKNADNQPIPIRTYCCELLNDNTDTFLLILNNKLFKKTIPEELVYYKDIRNYCTDLFGKGLKELIEWTELPLDNRFINLGQYVLHYILVDRSRHIMRAPEIKATLHYTKDCLKDKIWKMYSVCSGLLYKRQTRQIVVDGNFTYSYRLWSSPLLLESSLVPLPSSSNDFKSRYIYSKLPNITAQTTSTPAKDPHSGLGFSGSIQQQQQQRESPPIYYETSIVWTRRFTMLSSNHIPMIFCSHTYNIHMYL